MQCDSQCNSVLLHSYIRNSVVFLSKQVELYFDALIICLLLISERFIMFYTMLKKFKGEKKKK